MDPGQVAQLKVAELKEELKKRGLPLKGLKAELAERLLEAVRQEAVQHDETPKDVAPEAGASVQEGKSDGVDNMARPEPDPEEGATPAGALPGDEMDIAEANVEASGLDGAMGIEEKEIQDAVVNLAANIQVQQKESAEAGGAVEALASGDALIAEREDDMVASIPEVEPQEEGRVGTKMTSPAGVAKERDEGPTQQTPPDAIPAKQSPEQQAPDVQPNAQSAAQPDAEVMDMETENRLEPVGALEKEDTNRKGGEETVTDASLIKHGPEIVKHDVKAKGHEGEGKKTEETGTAVPVSKDGPGSLKHGVKGEGHKEAPKAQARTAEVKEVAERRRESGVKRAKERDASVQNGGDTDGRPAKLLKADGSQGDKTHKRLSDRAETDKTHNRKLSDRAETQERVKPAKPMEAEKSSTPRDRAPTTPAVRSVEKSNGGVARKRDVPASARPATRSLRVNNLVRPFTERALRALLSETGSIEDNGFWMDSIKTHCYVTFKSVEEATRTREALYNSRWPAQNPKVLAVSFVPESEVESMVKGASVPPSPNVAPGVKVGVAQEAVAVTPTDGPNQRVVLPVKERLTRPAADKPTPVAAEPPALSLDDLFRKTTTKPCIYWLPLTDEQVKQRNVALPSAPAPLGKGKAS